MENFWAIVVELILVCLFVCLFVVAVHEGNFVIYQWQKRMKLEEKNDFNIVHFQRVR